MTPRGVVFRVGEDDAQDATSGCIDPFELRSDVPAGTDDPHEPQELDESQTLVKTDRPEHAMEPETSGPPHYPSHQCDIGPDIPSFDMWDETTEIIELKQSIQQSRDYVAVLEKLRDHQRDDQKTGEPESAWLDMRDVVEAPALFQPRGGREVDPYHVDALVKVLRNGQELDPIRVLPVAGILIVFDGHHRLAAYQKVQRRTRRKTIPVVIEPMPVDMAVLEAGRANSPEKLGMTPSQKSEFAWRLVIARVGRQIDIAKATGRSDRSVRTMMNARDKLERRSDFKLREIYWFQARRIYQGEDPAAVLGDKPSSKETDVEVLATEWAGRLKKTFGAKPGKQPVAFARALEQAMPQAIDKIIAELQELRGDNDPDE